ncbi:MAG: T9SS type A sorting domain-containing protein, partial [candidate division Zixibacteria bacterium]|nr:T9SS type A sorting domain-containing protein [candidate division Zixibacteria bacterium]
PVFVEENEVSKAFAVPVNYPNPFNSSTIITFNLEYDSYITLEVYNMLGQRVATLLSNFEETGEKSFQWNAWELSSGIYFFKLTSGDDVFTRRTTLLK